MAAVKFNLGYVVAVPCSCKPGKAYVDGQVPEYARTVPEARASFLAWRAKAEALRRVTPGGWVTLYYGVHLPGGEHLLAT